MVLGYRRSGNFDIKNNSCKNFRVDKFSRIRSILEIFLHKMFYSHVKSQPQNYFNSEIFPIYGSCHHESLTLKASSLSFSSSLAYSLSLSPPLPTLSLTPCVMSFLFLLLPCLLSRSPLPGGITHALLSLP